MLNCRGKGKETSRVAVAQRLRAVAVDDPIVVQDVSGLMLGG
jgi:hypothetical protein